MTTPRWVIKATRPVSFSLHVPSRDRNKPPFLVADAAIGAALMAFAAVVLVPNQLGFSASLSRILGWILVGVGFLQILLVAKFRTESSVEKTSPVAPQVKVVPKKNGEFERFLNDTGWEKGDTRGEK